MQGNFLIYSLFLFIFAGCCGKGNLNHDDSHIVNNKFWRLCFINSKSEFLITNRGLYFKDDGTVKEYFYDSNDTFCKNKIFSQQPTAHSQWKALSNSDLQIRNRPYMVYTSNNESLILRSIDKGETAVIYLKAETNQTMLAQ